MFAFDSTEDATLWAIGIGANCSILIRLSDGGVYRMMWSVRQQMLLG